MRDPELSEDTLRRSSVAALCPKFASGYIVIDVRRTPRLMHAIGSRIYRVPKAAETMRDRARRSLDPESARHIHVVPVDGKHEHFALPFILADFVVVDSSGNIRRKPGAAA